MSGETGRRVWTSPKRWAFALGFAALQTSLFMLKEYLPIVGEHDPEISVGAWVVAPFSFVGWIGFGRWMTSGDFP